MLNYVIIAPPESLLTDQAISTIFDRSIAIRPGCAWAVSTSLLTCADVRKALVGGQDPPSSLCVVVKATEYNGYAKRELWEKLEAWERS